VTRIVFVSTDGVRRTAEAKPGGSVMEAAIDNNIAGIEAECYGACNCGTCHVYVDAVWRDKVGAPNEWEGEVLSTLDLRRENSRLSCQISVRDDLNGLVVHLPARQGNE
jgi:2Fe-2S ferredoxin